MSQQDDARHAWAICRIEQPGLPYGRGKKAVVSYLPDRSWLALAFAALIFLSACSIAVSGKNPAQQRQHGGEQSIGANSSKALDTGGDQFPGTARYPEEIKGTWRIGTEPCLHPLNYDGDGWLEIDRDSIRSFEALYQPVEVEISGVQENSWRVTSVEKYLGTQVSEVQHTFSLDGDRLTERDGDYVVVYTRCKWR